MEYYFTRSLVYPQSTSRQNLFKFPPVTYHDIKFVPPVYYKNNIHAGGIPHIPLAVEDIAGYFTKDSWQQRVITIRTIGKVRRLENENYILESVDKFEERAQVPLSRGTNRELRQSPEDRKWKRAMVGNPNKSFERDSECGKPLQAFMSRIYDKPRAPNKVKRFPFPDSVRNPESIGDMRVKDGAVYMVFGRLKWFNQQPIIDVDRFIPIHDLKSSYEVFLLQHTIGRRDVNFFKAHPEELREIERRPNEIREPVFEVPAREEAELL